MGRKALINGCIKVEKSAAAIYKKLMGKYPEKIDGWKELFDDEINHLSFLKDVKSLELTDVMEKMELPPSTALINETLKMADDLNAKIVADSISFKKVLAMALKLEESMIETYTNKIIANLLSCEDESSYKKIVSEEKKHINKLKQMMK